MDGRKPSHEGLAAQNAAQRRQNEELQQHVAVLEADLATARRELAAARQAAARQSRPLSAA
jgi:septal ring factor EnvC (AmiA/AmiB activator)